MAAPALSMDDFAPLHPIVRRIGARCRCSETQPAVRERRFHISHPVVAT